MLHDEVLRQMVIDELESEPSVDAGAIGVAAKNGVVTLTGRVEAYATKKAIEEAAQRVNGIRAVAEEILVDIPILHMRTDTDIAEAAVNSLVWDVTVPHERIKVKVENGWITLTGSVKYGYQKNAADKAIHNLTGVKGVRNLITVEPRAEADIVKKEISRVLHRSMERDIEGIKVETLDGIATLRGTVRTWAERDEAARAARNVPGVATVENYISVGA